VDERPQAFLSGHTRGAEVGAEAAEDVGLARQRGRLSAWRPFECSDGFSTLPCGFAGHFPLVRRVRRGCGQEFRFGLCEWGRQLDALRARDAVRVRAGEGFAAHVARPWCFLTTPSTWASSLTSR